jgi:hypothetical protein
VTRGRSGGGNLGTWLVDRHALALCHVGKDVPHRGIEAATGAPAIDVHTPDD